MNRERGVQEEREKRDRRDIALPWTRARLYIMVVFTSVAFLLTACKMGPDYTRPETPKADSWRVTASTAESIANLPWWELLKDPELAAIGPHRITGKPGFADRRRQHRRISGSAHDRQVRSGPVAGLLRDSLRFSEHEQQCVSDRPRRRSD